MPFLPVGKIDPELLERLVQRFTSRDPRLVLGPGIGLDCAVVQFGDRLLVAKTDPITFTAREIGWYAVNVCANDVATTGARPEWFLATLLLPERRADEDLVAGIFEQIHTTCEAIGAHFIGGHTEVTAGLSKPIVVGTMFAEVAPERLITPRGARPGDALLLTKGVPIEATSILAHDFGERLKTLPENVVQRARNYLHVPGISVVAEALAAAGAGGVRAMHDPTEGGLASGLWELSEASGVRLVIEREAIPVPPEAAAICAALRLDPLACIASGALLLAAAPEAITAIRSAIEAAGISVSVIGEASEGSGVVVRTAEGEAPLPWPKRDALAALFDPP